MGCDGCDDRRPWVAVWLCGIDAAGCVCPVGCVRRCVWRLAGGNQCPCGVCVYRVGTHCRVAYLYQSGMFIGMNLTHLVSATFTELALSADNVMVWALIIRQLGISARMERRVLAAGIAIAFVLRYAAITAGSVALERYSWLTYVLGAVLVWTGIGIARSGDDSDDSPGIAELLTRWFKSPVTVAIIALGVTDLVFAVDSIPASFGITRDANVIALANAIALGALWFMYRVVTTLMDRLPYLQHGLAVVLVWVGIGMLAHHYVHVSELVNFAVIVAVLGIASAYSIASTRRVAV